MKIHYRLVPRVYSSYKGEILPLLLLCLYSMCIFFLVLFIGKVFKHIFMHIKLKKYL